MPTGYSSVYRERDPSGGVENFQSSSRPKCAPSYLCLKKRTFAYGRPSPTPHPFSLSAGPQTSRFSHIRIPHPLFPIAGFYGSPVWNGNAFNPCTKCTAIDHASNPANVITCNSATDSRAVDGSFVCDTGYRLKKGATVDTCDGKYMVTEVHTCTC